MFLKLGFLGTVFKIIGVYKRYSIITSAKRRYCIGSREVDDQLNHPILGPITWQTGQCGE